MRSTNPSRHIHSGQWSGLTFENTDQLHLNSLSIHSKCSHLQRNISLPFCQPSAMQCSPLSRYIAVQSTTSLSARWFDIPGQTTPSRSFLSTIFNSNFVIINRQSLIEETSLSVLYYQDNNNVGISKVSCIWVIKLIKGATKPKVNIVLE